MNFSEKPVKSLRGGLVVVRNIDDSELFHAQVVLLAVATSILLEFDKLNGKIYENNETQQKVSTKELVIFRTSCMSLGGDEWGIDYKRDIATELFMRWRKRIDTRLPRMVESLCLDIIRQRYKGSLAEIQITPVTIDDCIRMLVRRCSGRVIKLFPPTV